MKFYSACFFFLALQFNANAQLGDLIIPYSELDSQTMYMAKMFGEIKRRHILDTTVENHQNIHINGRKVSVIFSVDSVRLNDTTVIQKFRKTNSQKLTFGNLYFPYPVIILGHSINQDIEFKDCLFEKEIIIVGNIKKSICFERNVLREYFQMGDLFKNHIKKGANAVSGEFIFRRNFVLKPLNIFNTNFKDKVIFYNNYFLEFHLAGCMFLKQFDSRSNLNGSLLLRFIKCESEFSIEDSKVIANYRINNSSFKKNLKMTKCLLQSTKGNFSGTIYQCVFNNALNLSGSSIEKARILNCFFQKDSSSLILDNCNLNAFDLESSTLPYLIDLSNARITDSGQVNLKKMEVRAYADLNLDSTVNWLNQNNKCYLYLDNAPLKNIHFEYEKFTLASVYYDPGLHSKTKDLYYDITPWSNFEVKGIGPFSGVEQSADLIGFGIVEQKGFAPPFSNATWENKSKNGIPAKELLYKRLLKKFEEEGDFKSYSKLDKEFYRFKLLEQDTGLFNSMSYYINKLWWDFGYRRSRIFLWTIILFIFFSLVNNFFIFLLNHKIYEIDNITRRLKVTDRLNRRKMGQLDNTQSVGLSIVMPKSKIKLVQHSYLVCFKIKSAYKLLQTKTHIYYSNLLLSFIYTGIIFFGFKIDINKFHLKWNLGTLWILKIYAIGIICLAFIAKVIIN